MIKDNPELKLGQIATVRQIHADSMIAEETIKFGKALMYGTDSEKQIKVFDGTTGKVLAGFAGFSIGASDLHNLNYEQYDDVAVLRRAVAWVETHSSVTDAERGDKVAVMPDGTVKPVGELSSGSGDYAIKLEDAEFKSDAGSEEKVKIEFSFPTAYSEQQLSA